MNNRKLMRNVPAGYALRVHHVHDPITLEMYAQGKPPRYITVAKIYHDRRLSDGRLDTVNQDPVVECESRCSHRDSPSRKVGYHISVTRALRELSATRRNERITGMSLQTS